MIRQNALSFTAISKKSNEKINLDRIIDNNLFFLIQNVFIVITTQNYSSLTANKYPTFNYVIVISDLEELQAESVFNLY